MKSDIRRFVNMGIFTSLMIGASALAAGETKLVCKKRTPQVYSAFYRTEVITNKDGQLRFEYGVGDSSQIYELYYFAPVVRTGDNVFETEAGVTPHLRVEIKAKRKYKELLFSLTDTTGAVTKRDGYRCE